MAGGSVDEPSYGDGLRLHGCHRPRRRSRSACGRPPQRRGRRATRDADTALRPVEPQSWVDPGWHRLALQPGTRRHDDRPQRRRRTLERRRLARGSTSPAATATPRRARASQRATPTATRAPYHRRSEAPDRRRRSTSGTTRASSCPVSGLAVTSGQDGVTPAASTSTQADGPAVCDARWVLGQARLAAPWLVPATSRPAGSTRVRRLGDWPSSAAAKDFGNWSRPPGQRRRRLEALTVPATRPPGTTTTSRRRTTTTGRCPLYREFQVCTLKPCRATVSEGTASPRERCRPDQGPRGQPRPARQDGDALQRASRAAKGQPPERRGTTAAGWTKVGTVRSQRLRHVPRTPYFQPRTHTGRRAGTRVTPGTGAPGPRWRRSR